KERYARGRWIAYNPSPSVTRCTAAEPPPSPTDMPWVGTSAHNGARLRFLVCSAMQNVVLCCGTEIGHSLELRIAKQCRGKKDNPATRWAGCRAKSNLLINCELCSQ